MNAAPSPRRRAPAPGLADLATALHQLGRLLSSRRVFANLVAVAGYELSQQSAQVLLALGEGTRSVADLARAAQMDVGAVSRQLRALEEAGLVRRSHSPAHGSVVLVDATPAGGAVAQQLAEVRNRQLVEALAGWEPEDREALGRLLLRFVEDLQATPYRRT